MFNEACDKNAPFKTKRIKGHLPEWVDNDFVALCKDRDYFYARAHKTNDDWKKAKTIRNRVNNMKFHLKKRYFESSIKENRHDSKKLWKTIKKVLPNTKTCTAANIVNPVDKSNVPTGKDTDNSFNQFFTSVGEDLGKQFNDVNLEYPCNNAFTTQSNDNDSFRLDDVSCDFVYSQICKMDNNKSTGLD